ncbi:hypothetical protein F4779DRAFT_497334 [Xylariaceae sp. FL0662B]|nr:hypothetical protein F4779DRAFT_497334 [Xylariaceae sp. FL0662B]
MAANAGFRFFDLPPELRDAILSYLLVADSDSSIVLHSQTLSRLPLSGPTSALNVFYVNLQMYQEASTIFYSRNHFIINAQSHRLPSHLTKPGGFLHEQGRDARRRVQSLTLYLTRVGGEFESILGPALSDMVLCGSLRQLRVRLGPQSYRGRSWEPDADMVKRPPFQALLRLLADPDLETVELLTWWAHCPALCPFHSNGSSESVSEDGSATLSDASWIQLDWRAMVDAHGTGQQIVRVGQRFY